MALLLLLVGGEGRLAGWQLHSPGPDCGVCFGEAPEGALGGHVMKTVVHAVVFGGLQSLYSGSSSGQQQWPAALGHVWQAGECLALCLLTVSHQDSSGILGAHVNKPSS